MAQHVSGDTPPIIRSSKTVIAISGFTYVFGCRPLRWLSHRSGRQPKAYVNPEAEITVLSSWWWAMCRPKHVEQLRNIGIINSTTRLHLVGSFCEIYIRCTDPWTSRILVQYLLYLCADLKPQHFLSFSFLEVKSIRRAFLSSSVSWFIHSFLQISLSAHFLSAASLRGQEGLWLVQRLLLWLTWLAVCSFIYLLNVKLADSLGE
jgi:hypothetical protein